MPDKRRGYDSRNIQRRKQVTAMGHGKGGETGMTSDGEEVGGSGVRYFTTLNERMNKSLNRNSGPERPMANKGYLSNPNMGSRKTGKTG